MAEREMLTQERVKQIVDGSKVDPNGYEFVQLARLALKSFDPSPLDEARVLIEKAQKDLEPLVLACEEDFVGEWMLEDEDDTAVGGGLEGDMALKIGHIRKGRNLLTAISEWLKANP